jgi:integrase
VPLSERTTAILEAMAAIRTNDFIFAGAKAAKGLSNMAMTNTMRRMGLGHYTVHGFRSTFRDWAAERTNTPNIVCEMALAHTIGNAAEAAYRRGDLLEKRRRLMMEWARYCEQMPGEVVSINGHSIANQN